MICDRLSNTTFGSIKKAVAGVQLEKTHHYGIGLLLASFKEVVDGCHLSAVVLE